MSDEDKAKFEKKQTKAAVRGKVYFKGMLYPGIQLWAHICRASKEYPIKDQFHQKHTPPQSLLRNGKN